MKLHTRLLLASILAGSFNVAVQAQSAAADGPAVLDDGRPLPVAPAIVARNERGVTVRAGVL